MPPQQQPAALRLLKGRGHGTDSGGRRGVAAGAWTQLRMRHRWSMWWPAGITPTKTR